MRNLHLIISLSTISVALADSSIEDTAKYAYSANAGWVNFKHDQPSAPTGVVIGEGYGQGYAYSANIGWIHFGNGSPDNGHTYSNTSATDYGVNHDGIGNLTGYAYSANTGWINFSWTSSTNTNRPKVSLISGAISGYAYSANIGWINLGTGDLSLAKIIRVDSDSDGIDDTWELKAFGNLGTADSVSDFDGDSVSDKTEYFAGSDPTTAGAPFQIISHSHTPDENKGTISFNIEANRSYSLQYTSDLTVPNSWEDTSVSDIITPAPGTLTTGFTYPANGGERLFFRVIADTPLR